MFWAMGRQFLLGLLDEAVKDARIGFIEGDEETIVGSGPGGNPGGSDIRLRVRRPRFFARIVAHGNLGLGEAFMDGDFEVETGELHEFLALLLRSGVDRKVRGDARLVARAGWIRLASLVRGKAGNVQRHYDRGDEVIESFLDPSLTYSCGYAGSVDDDLATLQRNKLDRICRKLRLREGERLLDIGCGYGSLLIHAGREYGARGTGVSLSRRHVERGRAMVEEAGLGDRIDIRLQDYGEVEGTFDKIVSVGMMEHVPRREYPRYFGIIGRRLAPRGLGLVHTIGCSGPKNSHDPFVQKYIFPGSNQPRLSEITLFLENNRLPILDVENIGKHYLPTLLGWLQGLRENRHRLASRHDERLLRMWEYFLHCGIAAAKTLHGAVYQVLFGGQETTDLPLHRV
jgi:cyclopropane-fatty-acyl-phospholipid synthase